MCRTYGSSVLCWLSFQRIKIRCYNICRTYGSQIFILQIHSNVFTHTNRNRTNFFLFHYVSFKANRQKKNIPFLKNRTKILANFAVK